MRLSVMTLFILILSASAPFALAENSRYATDDHSAASKTAAANETIIIGDSIFALSGVIRDELERLSPLNFNSYARTGAVMSQVVRQYWRSRANGIAKTVIMNGGGNDVLFNRRSCQSFNRRCINEIEDAVDQGSRLASQMADDGVEHIVFVGYYYTSSFASGLDDAIDYAMSRIPSICGSVNIQCEVVDTRDIMAGPGNRSWDGIHPSTRGSVKIARHLWRRMREAGIAWQSPK
jgi:lysophospholipase L1-like esterase